MATKEESGSQVQSDFSHVKLQHGKTKFSWLTGGRVGTGIAAVAVGAGIVIYTAKRSGNVANAQTTTAPSITATDHSASSRRGSARTIEVKNGASAENGDATSNSNNHNTKDSHDTSYKATANGPGGKAVSGQIVNENNVNSEAMEKGLEGKLDDWREHKKNAWLSDSHGDYIILPYTANRQTKITEPIALSPFASNRRAVVELRNVSPEWQSKFAFQVKAMRLFGDQDRQDGAAKAGQEFTILRHLDGDEEFYLSWRGEGTKEAFSAANPDATIVIRLLK